MQTAAVTLSAVRRYAPSGTPIHRPCAKITRAGSLYSHLLSVKLRSMFLSLRISKWDWHTLERKPGLSCVQLRLDNFPTLRNSSPCRMLQLTMQLLIRFMTKQSEISKSRAMTLLQSNLPKAISIIWATKSTSHSLATPKLPQMVQAKFTRLEDN